MFRSFGGTPVKIVCDNLKAGATSHPKRGEIILNEARLSLGGYYSVAIMPTGVKKPKQKASVEGSVGKIAAAVIARLRNGQFTSLAALNAGTGKAVKEFNDRPFRKRPGSRLGIFETEEKPYLRALPLIPYEVCEWSCGHKAGSNSHIWWNKGRHSVPCRYIGYKADVKFNSHLAFICCNRTEIAGHGILPKNTAGGIRTGEAHLPFPLRKSLSVDALRGKAREAGPNTFEATRRMSDEAKAAEQPQQAAKAILAIADIYSPRILEEACGRALRQCHITYYKAICSHAKNLDSAKELTEFRENNKKSGMARGADCYRRGETDK